MKWIEAIDELPNTKQFKIYYLKGRYRGRVVKFVGIYDYEKKKFFSDGSYWTRKSIQWLKE